MNETIGLFGGSFDPPHIGHVLAVHYVLLAGRADRVIVVPCAQHAFEKKQTPFVHRLAMTRLAFASLSSAVEVSDMEAVRGGVSYTLDTVRDLEMRFPAARIVLIIGSDLVTEIPDWHEAEELRRRVSLCILPRLQQNVAAVEDEQATPYYLPRISSRSLRAMIARDADVAARIPRTVIDYIREHGLFRE